MERGRAARAAAASLVFAAGAITAGCVRPGALSPSSSVARGRAQLDAGAYLDARQSFRDALARRPDLREARLGVAASFEATGDFDSARAIYSGLASGRLTRAARRQLTGRLELVARHEREQAAIRALAAESVLAGRPPLPNSFAVMPFRYVDADSVRAGLERGLAQLLVTDLGRIGAITVLERERVQAMLDEMRLAAGGRADSLSAVRSGRLLRAAHVVQGSLFDLPGQDAVRADAAVVAVATAEVAATGAASDRLEELFSIEQTLLGQIINGMGIPVTLAEQRAIGERPTASLEAFLAYGVGLRLEDDGRFAEAAAAYQRAVRIDPGFAPARTAAERAAALRAAAAVSLSAVTRLFEGFVPPAFVADNLNRVMPSGMDRVDRELTPRETPPPGERDPLGEVGGTDQVTPPSGYGGLIIKVRRP